MHKVGYLPVIGKFACSLNALSWRLVQQAGHGPPLSAGAQMSVFFFLTVAVSGGRAKTSVQVFVCSAPLSAQRAGLSEEHAATDGNHISQLTDQ